MKFEDVERKYEESILAYVFGNQILVNQLKVNGLVPREVFIKERVFSNNSEAVIAFDINGATPGFLKALHDQLFMEWKELVRLKSCILSIHLEIEEREHRKWLFFKGIKRTIILTIIGNRNIFYDGGKEGQLKGVINGEFMGNLIAQSGIEDVKVKYEWEK